MNVIGIRVDHTEADAIAQVFNAQGSPSWPESNSASGIKPPLTAFARQTQTAKSSGQPVT